MESFIRCAAVMAEERGMEGLWEKGRGSVSVVQQDKGNGSLWSTRPHFFWFLYDFFAGHCGTREVTVTHSRWVTVTRARSGLSALAVTIAGAVALAATGRFFNLRITITDSAAPAGVYRVSEVPAGRGALVAACLPAAIARTGIARGYLREGDCPAAAEPVAKVIGAVAGDVVDLEPGWVAVNGVKFSNSQTAALDSASRPLPHVRWGSRHVDTGEIWLFGFNDARSWDARYFGPVPRDGVRGVLRPVVTW